MSERDYTVTAHDEGIGSIREEVFSGKASDGTAFMLDLGVGAPVLTLNVVRGDFVVRESMDLTPMVTQWVTDIRKDMKKAGNNGD
jgi:hypothetical protein